ncbi:AsmA-like C-terminal domain-containing protein [Roseibium sp.]|uniref:AsmA-like C-terminal domain-containing protein n=1 Tax=Roseibium sp. TaxID=1936156 RepID=UPI003A987F62
MDQQPQDERGELEEKGEGDDAASGTSAGVDGQNIPSVTADTRQDASEQEKQGGNSGHRRRPFRTFGICLLVFFLTAAAVFAALYASGPVHVPYLAKWVAERASIGPAKLSIVNASFDLSAKAGVRVVLNDARLQLDGDVPVEVILPRVQAPIDGKALLGGKLHFASLELERPTVVLGVSDSGEKELPPMAGLMEAISRITDVIDLQFSKRNLAMVSISNAAFKTTGALARSFTGIDATMTRDFSGRLTGQARITGRFGPWEMRFDRVPGVSKTADSPGLGSQFGVKFRDITIGDLLNPDKEIQHGKGLGLPMSAEFLAQFDPKGAFQAAGAVGRVNKGWFRLGRTSVRFDDAAVELAWSRNQTGAVLKRSHIIQGNTRIFLTGRVEPPADGDSIWSIDLFSDYPQFGSADIPIEPVMLDQLKINARLDTESRTLFVDQASMIAGEARAMASATLDLLADGPYLAVSLEAENMPVGMAKQVWPITLVPPARKWTVERLKDGLIDHLNVQAAIRPPAFNVSDPDPGWAGDDLQVEMAFSDARLAPVGDVPDILGVDGTLQVHNEILTVQASDGYIAGTGETEATRVDVPEGTFKILNLPLRSGKVGLIDIKLTGGVGPVSEIFNSKPFEILNKARLLSEGVTGKGEVRFQAEFPLENKVDMKDVAWTASASATNFTSPHPIQGHEIKNADIELDADPSHVAIMGKGLLDGLRADIDLVIPLEGSEVKARQGVALSVNAKELKSRGIDLTSFIEGPMELNLEDLGERGKRFKIDLLTARLKLSPLGWGKAAGVPASASFVLKESAEAIRIENFKLQSEGVDVAGSIELGPTGDLQEAKFTRFRLREGDSSSLTVKLRGRDNYEVWLSGAAFDARGFLQQMMKGKDGVSSTDQPDTLMLHVSLDKVVGFNGQIERFAAEIDNRSSGIQTLDMTGFANGRAPFTLMIKPAANGIGREADGDFSDVGAVLRFLDIYKRMRGGQGRLQVAMTDETNWTGSFRVKDLSITEDPALKKLSERRSWQTGPAVRSGQLVPPVGGNGSEASFNVLELDFVRTGETLRITRGALQGAVFGGTVAGDIDLSQNTLNLTGTFVPIYALNNIFSKIPILGFALGGSSKEGLIGVTYRMTGALSDPLLSVNPLSAIAPGIFRKIFEFQQ